MDTMTSFLQRYMERKLTFDSDALNAIVGVLNVLSKSSNSLYHMWGIPGERTASAMKVALSWSQTARTNSHRRLQFPSWSPLGWHAKKIAFAAPDKQFREDSHQTIRIWENHKIRDIHPSDRRLYAFASQCLSVTAYSFSATQVFLQSSEIGTSGIDGFWMVVHIPKYSQYEHVRCLRGVWDDESFINDTSTKLHFVFMTKDILGADGLILKCRGEYFERVGSFSDRDGSKKRRAWRIPKRVEIADVELCTFLIR